MLFTREIFHLIKLMMAFILASLCVATGNGIQTDYRQVSGVQQDFAFKRDSRPQGLRLSFFQITSDADLEVSLQSISKQISKILKVRPLVSPLKLALLGDCFESQTFDETRVKSDSVIIMDRKPLGNLKFLAQPCYIDNKHGVMAGSLTLNTRLEASEIDEILMNGVLCVLGGIQDYNEIIL